MIKKATIHNLDEISNLFDLYRQFYSQPANIAEAKRFLNERLINNESVIYIAEIESSIAGFVQLYPVFTSVGLRRSWLLNDLFVKKDFRKRGIATELINQCKKFVRETNAAGLLLETSKSNVEGNKLYPSLEFKIQNEVNFYYWKNN